MGECRHHRTCQRPSQPARSIHLAQGCYSSVSHVACYGLGQAWYELVNTLIHPLVVPVVEGAQKVPHVHEIKLVIPGPGLKEKISFILSYLLLGRS